VRFPARGEQNAQPFGDGFAGTSAGGPCVGRLRRRIVPF